MSTSDRRPLPAPSWFFLGVAGALVGLLPWLATGARLPLQNLAEDRGTVASPIALLPFSQYFLFSIVALLVVGGAVAGVAGRALAGRRGRNGTSILVSGALVTQVSAIAQSTWVTTSLLEDTTRSSVYTGAVVAVMVVSIIMSTLVLLLVLRAPVPGAAIGLSLAAVVSTAWLGTGLRDILLLGPDLLVQGISSLLRWTPTVLVGCVLAWCGFRTAGRIAAAIVSLAALWIGPAFITAVSAAAGSRVLASNPTDMVEYALQVFAMALTIPELTLPSILVALAIGIVGSFLLGRLGRRRPARPRLRTSETPPHEGGHA